MRINLILSLAFLFILGIASGVFIGIEKVGASSPESEVSQGEQPASVYYDEHWQATNAAVSTAAGYANTDISNRAPSAVAAKIEDTSGAAAAGSWVATVQPKMVVTKWKVHGHIHFQ